MKNSYLVWVFVTVISVMSGIGDVNGMVVGSVRPLDGQLDDLDRRAVDCENAYFVRVLRSTAQMKTDAEMEIPNIDALLAGPGGGIANTPAATQSMRALYWRCKRQRVRLMVFEGCGMGPAILPDAKPKDLLLRGAAIFQEKVMLALSSYCGWGQAPVDFPYAGHPIPGVVPMSTDAFESLADAFAGILSFNGEAYAPDEWKCVSTFFEYCNSPHM